MKINAKDLLFYSWRAPQLAEEEISKENQKKTNQQMIFLLNSRLETIELVLANDKLDDVKILFQHLLYDLANVTLTLMGKDKIAFGGSISHLPNLLHGKEKDAFETIISNLQNPNLSTKDCEHTLDLSIQLYDYFVKTNKKQNKTVLYTELFKYKTIRKWRIGIFIGLVVFCFSAYISFQYKYPTFKSQNFTIHTIDGKENPNITASRSLFFPILSNQKGDWIEMEFSLPDTMSEFGGLRIDPLRQRGIRFSIRSFRIEDAKGRVLYKKDFVIGENSLPVGYEEFLSFSDVKTVGNLKPGETLEMISTGVNPQFTLIFPKIKDAKKISLQAKYIEAHKFKK
ncbi:hypothetical protein P3G55_17240 [Leptospira sp. 96542]|nr:hypothetical protein [Leptospira sp. 96542]